MSDRVETENPRPNPFTSLPWVLAVMAIPWAMGFALLAANGLDQTFAAVVMTVIVAPFVWSGTRDLEP